MTVLPCAQTDCPEAATHVVAETDPLNCLFDSGAGLCCEQHAEQMCRVGGIALAMGDFAVAIGERCGEAGGTP